MTTTMRTADDLVTVAVKRELVQVPDTDGQPRLARLLSDGQAAELLPTATGRWLTELLTDGFVQLVEPRVSVCWRGGKTSQGRLVLVTDTGRAYLRNWQAFGPCRDEDPELFFPASYAGLGLMQVAEAKAVCHGCPAVVRARCLRERMNDMDGIVGGTTPDERRDLRRREQERGTKRTPVTPVAPAAVESEFEVLTDTQRRQKTLSPADAAEQRRRNTAKQREYRQEARSGSSVAARTEGAA